MKIDSSTQLSQNRKLPDHQFVLIEPHLIIIVQVGILCKSIYPTDILLPHLVPSSCAWVTTLLFARPYACVKPYRSAIPHLLTYEKESVMSTPSLRETSLNVLSGSTLITKPIT